jgi:Tol biopolymer transport system component
MRPDGLDLQQLAVAPADDAVADWSRVGDQIVFESRRESDQYQIYTMNVDGSNVVRLTHTLARNFHPDWSPDGRRIAFVSERDGQSEIYVMNADGTDQRRLTFNIGSVRTPHWSPDGTHILFAADRAGNFDLYLMRTDGSDLRQLTTDPADDYAADWQPRVADALNISPAAYRLKVRVSNEGRAFGLGGGCQRRRQTVRLPVNTEFGLCTVTRNAEA